MLLCSIKNVTTITCMIYFSIFIYVGKDYMGYLNEVNKVWWSITGSNR